MNDTNTYLVIADDGTQYGPITESDLRDWIRDGRVNGGNQAWQTGMAEWKPLSEFTAFRALLAPPPPSSRGRAGIPPQRVGNLAAGALPALWNPSAAVNWSLLFTPAFGALLHARNAESLGRTEEAKANKMWAYISFAYIGVIFGSIFVPGIPDSVFYGVTIGLLVAWNFAAAVKQIRYVKQNLEGHYQRKSLLKPLSIGFGCLVGYFFVYAGLVSLVGSPAQVSEQKPERPAHVQAERQAEANNQARLQRMREDAEQKKRSIAQPVPRTEAPAAPPARPRPLVLEWNKQEIDVDENGNIEVAAQVLLKKPDTRTGAIAPEPGLAAKTPWQYYGKPVKFSGVVGVVQDYPPGSDISKMLGAEESSDIVILCQDETIVEMFCAKSSGRIKVGSSVTLYGYVCGISEVPNKLGGKFTHLMVVGNDYDVRSASGR